MQAQYWVLLCTVCTHKYSALCIVHSTAMHILTSHFVYKAEYNTTCSEYRTPCVHCTALLVHTVPRRCVYSKYRTPCTHSATLRVKSTTMCAFVQFLYNFFFLALKCFPLGWRLMLDLRLRGLLSPSSELDDSVDLRLSLEKKNIYKYRSMQTNRWIDRQIWITRKTICSLSYL